MPVPGGAWLPRSERRWWEPQGADMGLHSGSESWQWGTPTVGAWTQVGLSFPQTLMLLPHMAWPVCTQHPTQHPTSPHPWSSELNVSAGRPHGERPG